MVVYLYNLRNLNNFFVNVNPQLIKKELTPTLAYKSFSLLAKAAIEEQVFNQQIQTLIDKYSEKNEETGETKIPDEKKDDFEKEKQDSINRPIEIDENLLFTVDELEYNDIKLSLNEMIQIGSFIKM